MPVEGRLKVEVNPPGHWRSYTGVQGVCAPRMMKRKRIKQTPKKTIKREEKNKGRG